MPERIICILLQNISVFKITIEISILLLDGAIFWGEIESVLLSFTSATPYLQKTSTSASEGVFPTFLLGVRNPFMSYTMQAWLAQ